MSLIHLLRRSDVTIGAVSLGATGKSFHRVSKAATARAVTSLKAGTDAVCAGGSGSAGRTEHERTGGGEQRVGSSDARMAGSGRGDAVCAGGGSSAGRTDHDLTECGEHIVGSSDARLGCQLTRK